ncbi:MAG: metal ABC transporter permease [gamma proteobacterium symbiont of Bathyaustriella thionipta]|nr:metal ABC transporter permease [gamma proteobacterium symbiont of Bathyaustriella thionipta]MCU7951151.1 metal ABC transporter permease [gamma proteobacterium symbiont of Bathyaustriella thionipta]MCU7952862.1 metal ABC transporter permease [gamma proteobacterium symbiont of Bathyaustriella thionipta]MCU7957668.1 metal ABC transporter permease [gamma proteobacterium symbiont of Bathyaustriella thionipta]MCU7968980.1 metal ABC transporter permease [gamma proteobacterium symbiont of Bathyaustr
MNLDGMTLSILGPAFIAGLLVIATHVPLGQEVLKRGIIFIDLAIAQIAGLGVILAYQFDWQAHGWEVQAAALTSALLGAWLLSLMERFWGSIQEALIGVTFILSATASILLLANNPQGGEHLKELLVGQILWVTWEQLIPITLMTIAILVTWFKFRLYLNRTGFYLIFAVAVTSSVQLVGVYLVFASLIIPALASHKYKAKAGLIIGYSVGILGYGLGLIFSSIIDLPSGAVIVWSITIIALFFQFIFRQEKTNK